jgi:hypothetical protein
MAEIDACCEATLADATRTSPRDVAKVLDRATTTDAVPELSAALDIGDVSGGHVDVVGVVLRSCPPEVRQVLVDNGAWLARRAAVLSPAALRRELVAEVRELEGDGGVARLERQRRASRLRSWVDLEGMWRFDGRFDPETGLRLHNRLLATVQKLFADQIPDDAPHDPSNAKPSSGPEPGSRWSTRPPPAAAAGPAPGPETEQAPGRRPARLS